MVSNPAHEAGYRSGSSGRATYAHVQIEGLPKLMAMLDTNTILAQGGWREGVTEATKYLFDTLQKRTPRGKGDLLAAEKWEVQQVGVPRWGRVEIPNLPTRNGFRYGGALQGSKRVAYRYRMGQYGQRVKYDRKTKWASITGGKLTLHWWSGARGAAQRGINRIFEKLNQQIQQGWDRAA